MKIQLSDHFTYKRLLRFVSSTIIMMVFSSLYGIVDGVFVSNFVGTTSFAAVNLVIPVMMSVGSIGYMIGTGGSAIVAITLGEKDTQRANQYFSMVIYAIIGVSILLSIVGFFLIRPISIALGATGKLLEDCVTYGRILFVSQTAAIIQNNFQVFCSTAEKPQLSLKTSVVAGCTNIILDFLFIAVFHWGIAGAAVATAISQFVGGGIPLIYFSRKNTSLLQLTKTKLDWKILLSACGNGSSEMVSNLSSSVVGILYNFQLMRLVGENGVAAYGVILYVNFIFISAFLGYSFGSAPIVSYHYGAGNIPELKNMFKKSIRITFLAGCMMTLFAELSATILVGIFTSYDVELFEMTCHGFRIYCVAFSMSGICIWASSFFTALGNGIVSAVISFMRTLVFQVFAVLLLPVFLGINGIWLAVVLAELLALFLAVTFFVVNRKKYQYF